MSDDFGSNTAGLESPGSRSEVIIPSNTIVLNFTTRAIYVGGSGDLRVQLVGDTTPITLTGVAAGMIYPLRIARVFATGTTATGLVGLR